LTGPKSLFRLCKRLTYHNFFLNEYEQYEECLEGDSSSNKWENESS